MKVKVVRSTRMASILKIGVRSQSSPSHSILDFGCDCSRRDVPPERLYMRESELPKKGVLDPDLVSRNLFNRSNKIEMLLIPFGFKVDTFEFLKLPSGKAFKILASKMVLPTVEMKAKRLTGMTC